MSPDQWKKAVRALVAERATEGDDLEALLASLDRIDVDLDPTTAEHLLGLVAETLERRVRIDAAREDAERSLADLRTSSARLAERLEALRRQVGELRDAHEAVSSSPFRQYVGPVARA